MYVFLNHFLLADRLLMLAMGVALAHLWWRHREWRRSLSVLAATYLLLLVMFTPVLAHVARGFLERPFQPLLSCPDDADCIVVLAGYARPRDENRPEPVLGEDTLYRCLHAADLYRGGKPRPVMVSGGVVHAEIDMPPLSQQMAAFLTRLGVSSSDIIVEDRSTTTYENAEQCRKLLKERNLRHVVLVTEAKHMLRASRCFAGEGLVITPAPCEFQDHDIEWSLASVLPNSRAAATMQGVLHEVLGLLWYKIQGRIS